MQPLKNERAVVMATQLPSRPLSHQLISPETDSEAVKNFIRVNSSSVALSDCCPTENGMQNARTMNVYRT
jgi:hypothetical protein